MEDRQAHKPRVGGSVGPLCKITKTDRRADIRVQETAAANIFAGVESTQCLGLAPHPLELNQGRGDNLSRSSIRPPIPASHLVQSRTHNKEASATLDRSDVGQPPVRRLRKQDVAKLGTLQDDGLEVVGLGRSSRRVRPDEVMEECVHGVGKPSSLLENSVLRDHKRRSLAALGMEKEGRECSPSREGHRRCCETLVRTGLAQRTRAIQRTFNVTSVPLDWWDGLQESCDRRGEHREPAARAKFDAREANERDDVPERIYACPRIQSQGHNRFDIPRSVPVKAKVGQSLSQRGRVGLDGLQMVVVLNVVLNELSQRVDLSGELLVRGRVKDELAELQLVLLGGGR